MNLLSIQLCPFLEVTGVEAFETAGFRLPVFRWFGSLGFMRSLLSITCGSDLGLEFRMVQECISSFELNTLAKGVP